MKMQLIIDRKNSDIKTDKDNRYPKFEFHIAGEVRRKYDIEEELFSITGNIILADFNSVRKLVHKLNLKRDEAGKVRAGEVNAAGLIDEIFHYVIREYEEKENPGVFSRALQYLNKRLGVKNTNDILTEFVTLFPRLRYTRVRNLCMTILLAQQKNVLTGKYALKKCCSFILLTLTKLIKS